MLNPEQVLNKYFGYTSFRGQQKQIIDSLLEGRDVVAIMPTGAGKSICYQIPALMVKGITVVISPLISLMKDQVRSLIDAGIPAGYISSILSQEEQREILYMAYSGQLKLLYVSPERLLSKSFIGLCSSVQISYIAVDEAHCISQWGHDFRPSYSKISEFLQLLPERPPVGTFTATATKMVCDDIINILNLKNPIKFTCGFDRANLTFITEQPRNKFEHLITLLNERHDKSGIIYCSTRKTVDDIYSMLSARGFNTSCYHAGMSPEQRKKEQDDFLLDKKSIMIATNAFGMGIDKKNISFVIHYQIPQSIENYYQEAGRAGRDGQNAECILLFEPKDVKICEFLINQKCEENNEFSHQINLSIKKRDLKKLEIITDYAKTDKCLRHFILKYFGEISEDYCMNCSSCLANYDCENATINAQKVISCIFRLAQKNRTLGKITITEILQGVQNEKIIQNNFQHLPAFGTMQNLSTKYIYKLIDSLISDGYIQLVKNPYPVIKLCTKSSEIFRDDKDFFLFYPSNKKTIKYSSVYEKMRSVRATLCAQMKKKPEEILSNKALENICSNLPTTITDMKKIKEISEEQLWLYADIFIDCIKPYISNPKRNNSSSLKNNTNENNKSYLKDEKTPWKVEEDYYLKQLSLKNVPVAEISNIINRPTSMVIARMKLLCLKITK